MTTTDDTERPFIGPNLPPALSGAGAEAGPQSFSSSWAKYASIEAQRRGICRSPTTVIQFFDSLLGGDDDDDDDDGDEYENATLTTTAVVEDDLGTRGGVQEQVIAEPETHEPPASAVTAKTKKPRYSEAQAKHIKVYRKRIDQGTCAEFTVHQGWKNVHVRKVTTGVSKPEKIEASDFYVKPSIVWIPHKIIRGYVPHCPHCKSNASVDVNRYWWVDYPLMCYGRTSHKYLDTVRYPCSKCKIRFRATDLESMALDETGIVRAKFRFYIMKRGAAEEDLFLDVVKRSLEPTERIFKHLRGVVAQKYINDVIEFLVEVKTGGALVGSRPDDITRHAVDRSRIVRNQSAERRKGRLGLVQKVEFAKINLDRYGDFRTIMNKKEKKKASAAAIPGLGQGKLTSLIEAGVHSGRQLVDYYYNRPNDEIDAVKSFLKGTDSKRLSTIEGWVSTIEAGIKTKEDAYNQAKEKLERFDEESDRIAAAAAAGTAEEGKDSNEAKVAEAEEEEAELPKFSKFADRSGYNARFPSAYLIEDILYTYFLWRKPLMVQKAASLTGEALSMDANYKTPPRVVVYKKGIGYYRPWTGYVIILNEHKQVIWWGFIQSSESIKEIEPQLRALNERVTRAGQKVRLIWVDNCCNVRTKLQEIFPDAVVCLDHFHWHKRWETILADKKSEDAGVFRGHCR